MSSTFIVHSNLTPENSLTHSCRKIIAILIIGHYLLELCFSPGTSKHGMQAGGSLPLSFIGIVTSF